MFFLSSTSYIILTFLVVRGQSVNQIKSFFNEIETLARKYEISHKHSTAKYKKIGFSILTSSVNGAILFSISETIMHVIHRLKNDGLKVSTAINLHTLVN